VAERQGQAVGEVGLHVEDEELALGPLLLGGGRLEGLDLLDVPVVAVDLVHGQEPRREGHRAGHGGPAVHAELLRPRRAHDDDDVLDLLLLLGLRPRDELLGRDDLGRDGGIDALLAVALPLGDPHGWGTPAFGAEGGTETACGYYRSWRGTRQRPACRQ